MTNCQSLIAVVAIDRAGYTPPPVPPAEISSRIRFDGLTQATGPAPVGSVHARAARNVFVALLTARDAQQNTHAGERDHHAGAAVTDKRQRMTGIRVQAR